MSGEQAGQGEQKQEPYQEVTAGTQARDGEGVRALVRGKQMDLTLLAGMNAAVSSALL